MAGVWKRDGTVAVTSGNKKVTGTWTTFADTKNGVAKGHLFCITSGTSVDFYEVDYVVSNTELYLVQAYRGVTATGKAYEIITTFSDSVPEFARRLTATLSAYQQQSDAFQALLTSNAATIEVPAPDGTKQTLIPWKRVTSDGEGQAARAKVEADKATAAANLAVNVVQDAALPLPDVWLPLNDSLKLLTGYGREAKVGTDVVAMYAACDRATTATYIDKNGVLKTAAINEPRFEAQGLLVEGASTNLHKFSEFDGTIRADQLLYSLSHTTKFDAALGMTVARFGRDATVGTHTVSNRNVVSVAGSYCASALVKDDGAGSADLYLRDQVTGANYSRVTLNFLTGQTVSTGGGTFTLCLSGAIKKAGGWWQIWASATVPAGVSLQTQLYVKNATAEPGVDAEAILCAYTQLEAAPSPSSYIPTAGAAVTRAADMPYLQRVGNDNYFGAVTIAMNVSCNGKGGVVSGNDSRRGLFSGYPSTGAVELMFLNSVDPRACFSYGDSSITSVATDLPRLDDGLPHVVVAQYDTLKARQYVDGVKSATEVTPVAVYGADNGAAKDKLLLGYGANSTLNRHLWGHIRNFRIWHRALTDAQCKVVR